MLLLFHHLKNQKHHLNSHFVVVNYGEMVYDDTYDLFKQDLLFILLISYFSLFIKIIY